MTNFNKIDRAASFRPISAFPLDSRTYFEDLQEARNAAGTAEEAGSTDSQYYFGQLLTVKDTDGISTVYLIEKDGATGALKKLWASKDDISEDKLSLLLKLTDVVEIEEI